MKSIKKLTAISLSALTVYSSGINVLATSPANVYGQQKSTVSEALAGIPFYRKLIYGLSAAAVLGTGIGFTVKHFLDKSPVPPAANPATTATAEKSAAAPQPAASEPGSGESGLAATPEKTNFEEITVSRDTSDGIVSDFDTQRKANPIYQFFKTITCDDPYTGDPLFATKDMRYGHFRLPTSKLDTEHYAGEPVGNGTFDDKLARMFAARFTIPETEFIGDNGAGCDVLTPANITDHSSEYALRGQTNALGGNFGVTLTQYANLSDETINLIDHKKALFLNFANYTQYGGGFLGGGTAQEESMCLLSNLFASYIKQEVHDEYVRRINTHNREDAQRSSKSLPTSILISKNIGRTFVDDAGNLRWKDTGVLFDVASVAAPNFGTLWNDAISTAQAFGCSIAQHPKGRHFETDYINPFGTDPSGKEHIDKVKNGQFDTDTATAYRGTMLYKFMKWQYEQIIAYAHDHGIDTIVSGAFGCGVYKCDPVISALALKDALAENKSNNPASSVKRLVLSITGNGGKAALYDNKEITAIFKMVYGKDV